MSAEESWNPAVNKYSGNFPPEINRSGGFDSRTGIYNSLLQLSGNHKIPTTPYLDTASFVVPKFHHFPNSKAAFIDSTTNRCFTYSDLHRSIKALATGLHHLGVRKGDVVFLLSPNSLLYPIICLAVFSTGAILSPANPINTPSEIAKQVKDSGAKLAISDPNELHKLAQTGISTVVTSRQQNHDLLSVEELIECCDPIELPEKNLKQTDTAAILYSSGTTGKSKGVVLTHSNFISITSMIKWYVDSTSSQDDIFLCFLPMFHIYGLAFFALGMVYSGITSIIMQKFEMEAMIQAIETHKVNNIPAVPPVIIGLVKNRNLGSKLASLRKIVSGAAPLSKEVTMAFRKRFPWVELREGYGLTETCGAATFFVSDKDAKRRPGACGALNPGFSAMVVDVETGGPLPPCKEGEVWLKSPTVMKEYLGNEEATAATLKKDGWLRTGDLGYFDKDGFLYIVDRIKELIKHNGYQVAPAELEAVLLSHSQILDAAVIPLEDEESGQIPLAYVVKAAGSVLTKEQIIEFVAEQVAPYKKVRRVRFTNTIPKSAAGKILRKELVSHSRNQILSKL